MDQKTLGIYIFGAIKNDNYRGTIQMEKVDAGFQMDRSMCLSVDKAQKLMDDLWHCGLRPSQSIGSVGQLDAVKYHLEDMRKLVFKGK